MALFKTKNESPPEPSSSSNPYLNGREEWLERYGSYISRAAQWRMVAFFCLILTGISITGNVMQANQVKTVPYIEVDKLGKSSVVNRADRASATPQRLIQAEIAACISDWRTVTADVELQQKMIERLSFFMAGSAKGVFASGTKPITPMKSPSRVNWSMWRSKAYPCRSVPIPTGSNGRKPSAVMRGRCWNSTPMKPRPRSRSTHPKRMRSYCVIRAGFTSRLCRRVRLWALRRVPLLVPFPALRLKPNKGNTMKKIMLLLFACFYACPVWAASPPSVVPAGYPPALESGSPVVSEVDYISPSTVPLTDKEKHALHLSADWSRRNVAPVLGSGGKVVFVHGASLPTILAVPMQVCDVELESGETVNEIVVGDSARWMVDSGTAGSGPAATVHLFIKPVDAGLESSAVVTTDRRVYHLRLVSQRSGHTPYVGFVYSDDLRRTAAARKAAETRRATWESTTVDGERRDLSDLNFAYGVKGKAPWTPERVYDDGRQMFIRLPKSAASGEMPVLLVRKGNKDVLVNYRVKDSAIVVDGIFDKLALIVGVGGDQQKIEIVREGGRK